MKGIIMAGGAGTRLRPITCNLPKPMVPVMNKPVIEYGVELLKRHGINDIGMTLQYMPDVVVDWFDDKNAGIEYFIEDIPLGTAGSIKNAESFLDDTFIVLSGDALTDIDLSLAVEFHKSKGALVTLVLKRVEVPLEYGVVITDENGEVNRFLEKPDWSRVFSDTVNTGIYIMDPVIFDYIKPGVKFDFSNDLFPLLMGEGKPIYGYIADGYWCDIGSPESYLKAHRDFLDGLIDFGIEGSEIKKGVWIGEGSEIDADMDITAPAYIGRWCKIEKEASIGSYSIIGDCNSIKKNAKIKRSVVWDHTIIGKDVSLSGSVICDKVMLHDGVSVYEKACIGRDSRIMARAEIMPGVGIWPGKILAEGVKVKSNVVWGSSKSKTLFGSEGIKGIINEDFTPDFASKLGAAWGTILDKGSTICLGYDGTGAGRILTDAVAGGLASCSQRVQIITSATAPMTRYFTSAMACEGGGYLYYDGDNKVVLEILDEKGFLLNSAKGRKIENLFQSEVFSLVEGEEIIAPEILGDYKNLYLGWLLCYVDNDIIKSKNYSICMSANQSRITDMAYYLSERLGADITFTDDINRDMNNFDIGIIIDNKGRMTGLIDEKGRTADRHGINFLRFTAGDTEDVIYAPHTESKILIDSAKNMGKNVVVTLDGMSGIMGAMSDGISDDGNNKHEYMSALHFDGLWFATHILNKMAASNKKLSQLFDKVPGYYIREMKVECPWGTKGLLMRELSKIPGAGDSPEGVRFDVPGGWSLVLPHADSPVCRIITEGVSAEYADELAANLKEKVLKIISMGENQ